MLTKGAIGNLVNRYRAVLKKCNLINTFGSLAVASMLVLGGTGVAGAAVLTDSLTANGYVKNAETGIWEGSTSLSGLEGKYTFEGDSLSILGNGITTLFKNSGKDFTVEMSEGQTLTLETTKKALCEGVIGFNSGTVNITGGNEVNITAASEALGYYGNSNISAKKISLDGEGYGIYTNNSTHTLSGETISINGATKTALWLGTENGSKVGQVTISDFDTLSIASNGDGSGIYNQGGILSIQKGTNVTVFSAERSGLASQGGNSTIDVEGDVTISSAISDKNFSGSDNYKKSTVYVDKGTVVIEAGGALTIEDKSSRTEKQAIFVNGGTTTLTADGDVNVTGNVLNTAGTVELTGKNTTINGDVHSKGYGGTTTVASTGNTIINGTVKISNDKGGGDTINVGGKNIVIDAGSDYAVSVRGGYYGFSKPTTANIGTSDTESVSIKGSIGIISQYEDSDINVYGKNLVIEATTYGIYTGNNSDCYNPTAEVNVYSDQTTVTMAEGGSAIVAFSDSTLNIHGGLEASANNAVLVRGQSTVNINMDGKGVVKLDGDINFNNQYGTSPHVSANNTVNINLTTPDSYLNGRIYVSNASIDTEKGGVEQGPEDVGTGAHTGMSLGLSNGATWQSSADSFVNNMAMNNGVLSVMGLHTVDIDTLSGTGGTLKALTLLEDGAVKTGTVNIENIGSASTYRLRSTPSTPSFNVIPVDANGNPLTADEINQDQLSDVISQTITGDAGEAIAEDSTATAAAGIVNDMFTVNNDGEVVSGGGASSVTKAVLEAASVNTVALDKILTNDVRKRLGDIRSDKNTTGVWMRWDGGKLKGSNLTNEFNTVQIGGDTKVAKNCRLGVAGSFTHGDGDFDRGHSQLEGFTFAGYAAWMGDNGMFADVVARLGHFSSEVNVEGMKGDMDNRVFSLSGEYGWRLPVFDQFFVEPQVELAYTYVNSSSLELGTAEFAFDNVDSLTGRAGVVFGWNLPDDRGNVYARASVLQQFMGDAKVTGFTAAGTTVHKTDGDDTWVEYGIGANVKLTDKTYIWADVERTEGAELDEEWRGTVGIRYSF